MEKEIIRVLIIEDEIKMLKALERMLFRYENIDFKVLTATCLAEGLDCLSENQIDIILLDLTLPDNRGLETLNHVIVKAGDIPIIVITGVNSREIAVESIRKGAQDFILKSQLDSEHLIQSIKFAIIRKNLIKTMKSSHKNYQSLAETANDIILTFDLDGVIRYSNPAAQKVIGYSGDEMRGMKLADFISEEQFNDMMDYLGGLLSGQQAFALFEGEFFTKNGTAIPIEINSTMVKEFDNQSGFVMIARDITQHKRALRAASENAHQLRKIIEKNTDGIIILDLDGVILFANPSAGLILGKKAGELQGKYLGYETNGQHPQDIEVRHGDGKKMIVEIRSVQTDWEGNPAFLCTLRDVTMRIRIEEELKNRTRELKKTIEELRDTNKQILEHQAAVIKEERLRVLLQLADQTFYDINKPLNVIMRGIDALKRSETGDQSTSQHLSIMETACFQIVETLNKIEMIGGQKSELESNTVPFMLLDKAIIILAIEDSEFSFKMLKGFLRQHENISVRHAKSIAEAYQAIAETDFDLIFLDYSLPDGNGFDFLAYLKANKFNIPVIFITGKGDEIIASKALQAGAYEYLTKDMISKKNILEAIGKSLSRFSLQNEIKLAQKRMSQMSFRDEMTGLYNYRYFSETLVREMSEAKRYKNDLVLCMMDLDHFKRVNDTYGHSMGDNVLRSIGALLIRLLRKSDIACRYGGEEFTVILPHTNLQGAFVVMERFLDYVAKTVHTYNDITFNITVSIGLAQYNAETDVDAEQLIKKGDQALYIAKETGRNKIVKYEDISSRIDVVGDQ